MFEIGYAYMRESVLREEQVVKQLDKLDRVLRQVTETVETGMPAWVKGFGVTQSDAVDDGASPFSS